MKRILCILLTLSTIASMLVFGIVSANGAEIGKVDASYTPEGTAITSAAEFAAMAADGKYYLASDITVDASYANAFKGTFDGNGKTVTSTAPLFADLAGTVKNLTVNANIPTATTNNAIVAVTNSGDVTFENVHTTGAVLGGAKVAALLAYGIGGANVSVKNCVNDADLTGTSHVAGFVATIDGISEFLAENCTNNGDVTSTEMYSAGIVTIVGKDGLTSAQAATTSCTIRNCTNTGKVNGHAKNSAGIVGYSLGVITIENCVNRGDVNNTKENAAGILGSSAYQTEKAAVAISGCENYGKISAAQKVAGISVYFGRHNAFTDKQHTMENCVNYGDLYLAASGAQADGCQAAGIAARTYTTKVGNSNHIKNCVNFGNIYVDMTNGPAATNAAGIIAYTNQAKYIFENNINLGNITVTNGTLAHVASTIVLRSTSSDPTCVVNNYGIAIEGVSAAVSSTEGYTFTDAMVKTVNAAQVASGEMVYTLNEAAGKTVFYQNLKTGEITLTAAEDGSNLVIKNADGTFSNPAKEPAPDVTTTPGADVTTTPTPDVTTPEAEVTTTVPDVTTTNEPVSTTVPTETTATPEGTTVPSDTTTYLPADTTVPDETTNAVENTTAAPDETTAKPVDTTAKPVDTTAPEKKGCGGFVLAVQLVAILGAGITAVIVKKK